MVMTQLEYIIRKRIQEYEHDLECIEKMEPIKQQHEQQRSYVDGLMIEELNKLLSGDLEVLTY